MIREIDLAKKNENNGYILFDFLFRVCTVFKGMKGLKIHIASVYIFLINNFWNISRLL